MESCKVRLDLARGRRLAEKICAELSAGCDRIEIAGSVRRGKADVGDIEIVCIPAHGVGLFPDQCGPSRLDPILVRLLRAGRLLQPTLDGDRQKMFGIPAVPGLQLDLFITDRDGWGVVYGLRTGPAEFSRACVTPRSLGGRLRDGLTVAKRRVWKATDVVTGMIDSRHYHGPIREPLPGALPLDTPEERDFFDLAGGWLDPDARHVGAPMVQTAEVMSHA